MTTAPLRKAASRDEDESWRCLNSLRQAHHDKDAAAIAAAFTPRSSAIWRRRCFIAASM